VDADNKTRPIRRFAIYRGDRLPDKKGKICIVILDQYDGGIFRGHCSVWFGEVEKARPVVWLALESDLEMIEMPFAKFEHESAGAATGR
jgi:hypothetical protein